MEDIEKFLKAMFISAVLTKIHEEGEMKNFVEFAKKQAKEDGEDTEELMEFFDFLEELENEDTDEDAKELDWIEIADAISKETGCEVSCFRGNNTLIISNEQISDVECLEYLDTNKSKIHIDRINKVIKPLGVKLEFIEALNLPFEFCGFSNFIRFGVHRL